MAWILFNRPKIAARSRLPQNPGTADERFVGGSSPRRFSNELQQPLQTHQRLMGPDASTRKMYPARLFKPSVRDGYAIAKDGLLGQLVDAFGDKITDVRALLQVL